MFVAIVCAWCDLCRKLGLPEAKWSSAMAVLSGRAVRTLHKRPVGSCLTPSGEGRIDGNGGHMNHFRYSTCRFVAPPRASL